MGFLDFFKRVSNDNEEVKEFTLLETGNYIDSWSKTARTSTTMKLEEIKILIEKEKNKAYENNQTLLKAELKNPNIPERAKNIMAGNREIYVKRIERLLETVSLPKDFNKLLKFSEFFNTSLNDFTKETIKNYKILNEFFLLEMRNIDDNIKELIKLIKSTKDIVEESKVLKADELKKRVEQIDSRINLEKKLKEKIKLAKEKIEEENRIVKKEENNLRNLEEGKDYEKFNSLINKKKLLIEKREYLEKELMQNFSVIMSALKKYERLTLDQELVKSYLENPLQMLLLDRELKIVELLSKMNKSILNGKVELKEKKKDKTLQKLTKLNKDYFKEFTEKHEKLTIEINPLNLEQENMTIIEEIEEQREMIKQKKDKLDSTKTNIENFTVELEKIDIQKLKDGLTKEIKQVINKEIVMLLVLFS